MYKDTCHRIQSHPDFIALVEKRRRFAWQLSAVVLTMYAGFILLVGFAPEVLATPITKDSVTSWGVPIGIFIIVMSFLLTGVYVKKANTEFDEENQRILEECQQ
ncbi:DUF485 domain-containing protein [Bacterioplanoides pacificum]|uniref:DUF485 domain-containing protein n=1 Tax=Bacterioplanoides pacificum TaxID=1171596 RepID=A0ABV7VNU4_9GAMM